MRDMVLVLNFNDIASRAVTRKLRSERVLCKIVPGDSTLEEIRDQDPMGIVLVSGEGEQLPQGLDFRLVFSGMPILALGDMASLLVTALEGEAGPCVLQGAVAPIRYTDCPLLENMENGERLLQCARALQLPPVLRPICYSQDMIIGYAHDSLPLYGVQFQVEQNDPESSLMLRNFALNICGCTTWWDDDAFVARAVDEIARVVGDGTAVCAMTGGLDSGVSALLAFKALGSRLKCIFVDTGLLRDHEGDDFMAFYRDTIGMDIIRVYAQDRFLTALEHVTSPDEKRRVIGETMQQVLLEERQRLGAYNALIRGTSFNDIMFGNQQRRPVLSESVPVIEPVRELFKDEIRRIGDFLGMPQDIVSRQPFPGSGLALRILGEVTPERLRILRAADAIFRSEIARSGQGKRLWQYFAVLSPMPGEEQGAVIALRAVHASERTLAYAARLPYDLTETVVERIMREQPEVQRVVYDLTPSSNYTGVEWQ
ncbi:MAG: hypothetical protein E7324_01380 [Clostridiales bacterium]|nr:hypothetical protein [Clostridiales bacterium]